MGPKQGNMTLDTKLYAMYVSQLFPDVTEYLR